MFPRAMKSKVSTSNYGGYIGVNPSYPGVLIMSTKLELSFSTYGTIGTNACICSHGDSSIFVQSLLPLVGWFVVGVVADPILAVFSLFVPYCIPVVCKLGFVVVVVVVVVALLVGSCTWV